MPTVIDSDQAESMITVAIDPVDGVAATGAVVAMSGRCGADHHAAMTADTIAGIKVEGKIKTVLHRSGITGQNDSRRARAYYPLRVLQSRRRGTCPAPRP